MMTTTANIYQRRHSLGATLALLVLLPMLASGRAAESAPPVRSFDDMPVAVLGGLDKITARTTTLIVPVGQTARFGQLSITVRACRKAPPIEPPEATGFIEISEQRDNETPQARFSGWMFASSPALSAMDHAVYDVWVIDCKKSGTNSGASGTPGGPAR